MPFQHCASYSFSSVSVGKNAPAGSGVYGISNNHEWIFVGVTDNIQAALLTHLRETNSPLHARAPMGFVYELCGSIDRTARQKQLLNELDPVCNRQSRKADSSARLR